MRIIRTATLALIAALSIAADKPHPDWTATVTAGAGGSHVLGNPEAKVKLTEFISYTCGHCAHFHVQSDDALKVGYVLRGKLSLEVRHLVRDKVDLAAALLAHCGEPRQFFRTHNVILRSQDKWMPIMGSATAGQKARWDTGGLGSQMKAIAQDFGFYKMMEQRGYRPATLDRCLADEGKARLLTAQTQAAVDAGVAGTPSFMINGTLLAGTHDWKSLDTQIKARF